MTEMIVSSVANIESFCGDTVTPTLGKYRYFCEDLHVFFGRNLLHHVLSVGRTVRPCAMWMCMGTIPKIMFGKQ